MKTILINGIEPENFLSKRQLYYFSILIVLIWQIRNYGQISSHQEKLIIKSYIIIGL